MRIDTSGLVRFARHFALATCVVALLWPHSARPQEPALAGGDWQIVEVSGRKVSNAGTVNFATNRISGTVACNQFFATLSVSGRTLAVGPISTTRKFCHDRMILERGTLDALASVTSVEVNGTDLVLLGVSGAPALKLKQL